MSADEPPPNRMIESLQNNDVTEIISTFTASKDSLFEITGEMNFEKGHMTVFEDDPTLAPDSPTLKPLDDVYTFPDGGLRAWMAVGGAFFFFFNSWGVTTTYGVFQAYYKSNLLPQYSSSTLGWIQSVQLAFIFWGGTLTGRLFDLGYFYYLVVGGILWSFFCYMMVAQSTEFYQLLLSQGFGLGLGMGCCFGPSMSCLVTYFKLRRGLASGLASAGAGIGGVILPIVANNLFPTLGFRWTVRILAFIHLGVSILALTLLRPRFDPRKVKRELELQLQKEAIKNGTTVVESSPPLSIKRLIFSADSWVDPSAFHDIPFLLAIGGIMGFFLTLYLPYYYLQQFATGLGMPQSVTKYVVTILAAGSTIGRVLSPYLADAYGAFNMLIICVFMATVMVFSWNAVNSSTGVIVYAAIYGVVSGGVASFPPFILPHISPDIRKVGVRVGMSFICFGLISLVANPIGGTILKNDRYHLLACWSGIPLCLSLILLIAARIIKDGTSLTAKV